MLGPERMGLCPDPGQLGGLRAGCLPTGHHDRSSALRPGPRPSLPRSTAPVTHRGWPWSVPSSPFPRWQQTEANCTGIQAGRRAEPSLPTPDVASVTDPAGDAGSLEGSGGAQPVTGTVIFPQVVPEVTDGSSLDIAVESCSIHRHDPLSHHSRRLRREGVSGARLRESVGPTSSGRRSSSKPLRDGVAHPARRLARGPDPTV